MVPSTIFLNQFGRRDRVLVDRVKELLHGENLEPLGEPCCPGICGRTTRRYEVASLGEETPVGMRRVSLAEVLYSLIDSTKLNQEGKNGTRSEAVLLSLAHAER